MFASGVESFVHTRGNGQYFLCHYFLMKRCSGSIFVKRLWPILMECSVPDLSTMIHLQKSIQVATVRCALIVRLLKMLKKFYGRCGS